jgi:hypothetical protein
MLGTDIASYLIRGDHSGVTEKFTLKNAVDLFAMAATW